ncbi:MAG: tetraacyldisaccharide 4'-kinase [Acidobacteria bacterium]|nr:MAG: tetraacyldisaccharide 4'-kinase [Acidobacteriota bacterium]
MNDAAKLALTPLSIIYGLGVRIRNALYRRQILRARKVDAPVISVGNLTVGGTGKTPLVEWIANQLAQSDLRVTVLTRGYGRESSGRVVVSDRNVIRANVDEAGDEPFFLAQNLNGRAAVICDADRFAGASWAIEHLESDVFILDDAFQHQRLKRDLNILTIDARSPWGDGKLLPAGTLREPITELSRADCVVITRAVDSGRLNELRKEIESRCPGLPTFVSRIEFLGPRKLNQTNSSSEVNEIKTQPIAAFCGIGNPESFFSLLRSAGYQLKDTRAFRDHYKYKQADIDRVVNHAAQSGAQALLTTAKDAVKLESLSFALPCYIVDITIEIEDQAGFLEYLNRAVGARRSSKSY